MTRDHVAAVSAFFYKAAQRRSLIVVARKAGVMLGLWLLFGGCQVFLLSDDATFADAGEGEGGAPDAGTDTAGCQGCQIAEQCVQSDVHNDTNWCEMCAPQRRSAWSYACAETEACNGAMQQCRACEADECFIARTCWADRAKKPDNACFFCDPARDRLNWSLNTGDECDDRNFCTVEDRCVRGTCVGEDRDCDEDRLTCTVDVCNPAAERCEGTIKQDFCVIGGTCVGGEQINPDHICQVCNPGTDPGAYSVRKDLPCDDGLTCTVEDRCGMSLCAGTLLKPPSSCPAGYCDEGGRCGGDLVATGASHSCVLHEGMLYCFGGNQYGQLGDATTAPRDRAVPIGLDSDWSQVVAGDDHTCGRRGGAIYCWGDDQHGQLGNGKGDDLRFLTPQRVGTGEDWGALAAGRGHTCAIRQGALYCWGQNTQGQLGDGTTDNRHSPTLVGTDMDWIAVTAGFHHTCGLRGDDLYCWGDDSWGQLGDGTARTRQTRPVAVTAADAWSRICAGDVHTCGLRFGTLFCWGSNAFGKLGLTNMDVVPQPERVLDQTLDRSWETIVCGGDHTCATRAGGELFCWGLNDRGQLGDGTMANSTRAQAVISMGTGMWTGVSSGRQHTCGVQGGVFRCWGLNDSGQLGDGTTMDRASPVAVTWPP
jgi:alpha-tubulin suppressor-like RCC1 family protein